MRACNSRIPLMFANSADRRAANEHDISLPSGNAAVVEGEVKTRSAAPVGLA